MKIMKSALPLFLLTLPLLASAQADKRFEAVYTPVPPEIDGRLDDAAWASAPTIDDFHQVEPIEFDPARETISVRVLYDEDFLYVAADIEMEDRAEMSAYKLAQGTSVRGGDDWFSVIVDPYNNKRAGYRFQLNPNGVRDEGIYDGPGGVNSNWQGIWNGKAQKNNRGWTAEFSIPFKTLNFDAKNSDWGISFELRVFGPARNTAWTSQNRDTRPGTLGTMTGITRAEQGKGLDIKVSGSAQHHRDYVLHVDDSAFEPSLDIFYKITPSMTTAMTINTDFSATEVDDRVVNLSRFSVFFPEKRAFFLQDADIFSFGGIGRNGTPFHSRRMGLDENRQPIDIVAGGKLTGRIGRFNIGMLDVVQESVMADDVNLFVGRASMNVLDESALGFIVTDGSPDPAESNNVFGVDFNYRDRNVLGGKGLRGSAWLQKSGTDGVSGGQDAHGLSLSVPRSTGFYGGVGYQHIGQNFYPALGFVNRRNIRSFDANLGYSRYPRGSWFQFWRHNISFEHVEDLDGNVESQEWGMQVFQTGNHAQDWFTLDVSREREVLTDPFEISDGVVIAPGDYSWNNAAFEISSGEQREFYSSITISNGGFYDGSRLQVDGRAVWQPSMHFSAQVGFDYNDIDLSSGAFVSRLLSLNTVVAFTSETSWITLAQWDSDSQEVGINSRVKWVPQPGRELIFVVNHGHLLKDDDPLTRNNRSLQTDYVVKATYTFRF